MTPADTISRRGAVTGIVGASLAVGPSAAAQTAHETSPADFARLQLLRARALADSAPASFLLLFCFFWCVAAASHSGFMGKWALRDQGTPPSSIEGMLDGSADKPFVYRQLAPIIANLADRITPDDLKAWLRPHLLSKLSPAKIFSRAGVADRPEIQYRYAIVYYMSFVSLLLALFVLRQLLLDVGLESGPAAIAPATFLLALPYIQTLGGYFYDNIEIVFLALAVLFALRSNVLGILLLTPFATLNKETFFFFIPTLYPLLLPSRGREQALATVGAGVVLAGLVNITVKYLFSSAGGSVAELHLFETLLFYLNPANYFRLEVTYGLVGPSELFAGTVLVIATIALRGWRICPRTIKQHVLLSAAINFPLFLVFCKGGELRDLSFLFVGFVVLMGCALESSWTGRTTPRYDRGSR